MQIVTRQERIIPKVTFLFLIGTLVVNLWLLEKRRPDDAAIADRLITLSLQKLPTSIRFPEYLSDISTGDDVKLNINSLTTVKILNLLNTGCYRCIEDLPQWRAFMKDFSGDSSLQFIFIAQAPTRRYLQYIINQRANFSFPVYYDSANVVGKLNNITEIPTTMLLDQKNRVILGGSPILHANLKPLYREKIQNLTSYKN
jgi:hypothetical protein